MHYEYNSPNTLPLIPPVLWAGRKAWEARGRLSRGVWPGLAGQSRDVNNIEGLVCLGGVVLRCGEERWSLCAWSVIWLGKNFLQVASRQCTHRGQQQIAHPHLQTHVKTHTHTHMNSAQPLTSSSAPAASLLSCCTSLCLSNSTACNASFSLSCCACCCSCLNTPGASCPK